MVPNQVALLLVKQGLSKTKHPIFLMKLIDVAMYVVYVATYIIVVPVGTGLYYFKYLSKPLKVLLGSLLAALVLDIILLFFTLSTTFTFLYVFTAIDVLTMTWLFSMVIRNKKASRILIFLGFLFITFIIADAFILSGYKNNGYSNAIEKALIWATAVYYLTQLFQEDIDKNLLKQPMLWVSAGVIVYNLIGFLDVFSKPMVTYSQNLYLQFYMIWSIAGIIMYGCFCYAFWLCKSTDDVQ